LETLFNNFYEWYVPRVIDTRIRIKIGHKNISEDAYASRFMSAATGGNRAANERVNRAAGRDKETVFDGFVNKLLNMTTDPFMNKRLQAHRRAENKKTGRKEMSYNDVVGRLY